MIANKALKGPHDPNLTFYDDLIYFCSLKGPYFQVLKPIFSGGTQNPSLYIYNLCVSDNKTQEELLRTTQLVYSKQHGKMVPRLREPRQLYGFNAAEFGPQQQARWSVGNLVL